MENKVLEKNLNYIAKYNNTLANTVLITNIEKSNITLCKTSVDEYNLVYNNCPIHSNSGACIEAQNITNKINDDKNFIRIVYGLGMGYLADEMAKKINNGLIIIYEPNLELLKFVLSLAEIDALYKNNVFICADKNQLQALVKKLINCDTNISISFLDSYKQMYQNDIKDVLNHAQKALAELIGNKNTFLKKAPDAILNSIINLKNIVNNPDISCLKDVYKNKTALIISAGPSFADNIEILKNNKDKFVIFAVNTTLNLLSENGIVPDFVVSIEAINNFSHFSKIDAAKSYFILEAFTHPDVSSIKSKKTFNYISQTNFLNPVILDALDIKSCLKTLGTVSYTALYSAFIMGFDKIILLGSDLAYPDGKCYAKGSQYEGLECVYDDESQKYVIKPKDMDSFIKALVDSTNLPMEWGIKDAKNYLENLNNNIYTVVSQTGKNIPTQAGYALFIDYFKNAAIEFKKAKPELNLINSSTNGAQIDGFENISLSDVVKNLESVGKIDLSKYIPNYNLQKAKIKIDELLNYISEYMKLVDEFISLSNKLHSQLEIKKTITSNIMQLAKKHKEVLAKMIKICNSNNFKYISILFEEDIMNVVDSNYLANLLDSKRLLFKMAYQFGIKQKYVKKLYDELANSKSFIFK